MTVSVDEYKYVDLLLSDKNMSRYRNQIVEFVQKDDPDNFFLLNFTKYMNRDIPDCLAFILILHKHQIFGFSSVKHVAHWPKTIARMYNRHYLSSRLRKMFYTKGLEGNKGYKESEKKKYSEITYPMYNMMLEACKTQGIKTVVVTRQNKGCSNVIKTIHLKMNLNDPYKKWKLHSDYLLTCNYPERQECWQRAVFRSVNEMEEADHLIHSLPGLSLLDYNKKFISSKNL